MVLYIYEVTWATAALCFFMSSFMSSWSSSKRDCRLFFSLCRRLICSSNWGRRNRQGWISTLNSFSHGFWGWGNAKQPVHVGICLIWQLLPCDRSIPHQNTAEFDWMHRVWPQQQNMFSQFFWKLPNLFITYLIVALYYLCCFFSALRDPFRTKLSR